MTHFNQSYKSKNYFKRHRFHIITKNDSLPFFVSLAIGSIFLSLVNYWHYGTDSFYMKLNFFLLVLILFDWFFTVNKESVNGFHTKNVQVGILKGMILFIVSEIMFFFSIFWAFFHFKINPSFFIECIFPPIGINIIKMNCFPLLNTVLLVYSGLFLMNSIYYLKKARFFKSYANLVLTIILGLLFVLVQFIEYSDSTFSFNDSCYGSIFFLLTGFHGFHVIVGLIFLLICAYRLFLTYKFNSRSNLGGIEVFKYLYLVSFFKDFYKLVHSKDNNLKNKSSYSFNTIEDSYDFFDKKSLEEDFLVNMIPVFYWVSIFSYEVLKTKVDNSYKLNLLNFKSFFFIKDISSVKLGISNYFIKNSDLSCSYYNQLFFYCNSFKKKLILDLIRLGLMKKIFSYLFLNFFNIQKSDKLNYNSEITNSYNFILKFFMSDIDTKLKSTKFYAWKSLLLWINYNHLNLSTSNFNMISRRIDHNFITPYIGFKRDSNIGYICASWYWHFVDAIWLVVISVIYSDLLLIIFT